MYRIILVVDDHSGERLLDLARHAYVWAVQSNDNDPWATKIWQEPAVDSDPERYGLSTFARLPNESIDDLVIRLLEMIEDHHGAYAHAPAWSEIEVRGASPSQAIADAAKLYGVTRIENTSTGFFLRRANC